MVTDDYNELPNKWILFIIAQKYNFFKVLYNAVLILSTFANF